MSHFVRVFFSCAFALLVSDQGMAAQYRYDFTGVITTVALYNSTEEQLLQATGIGEGTQISFSVVVDYDAQPQDLSSRYDYSSLSKGTLTNRNHVESMGDNWSVARETLYSVRLLSAETGGNVLPGIGGDGVGWGRQVADGSGESQEGSSISKADYVQQLINNGIEITPALQAQIDALPDPIVFAPDNQSEGDLFSEMIFSDETALHLERETIDTSSLTLDDFLIGPHDHWQQEQIRFSILSIYFDDIRTNLYGSLSLSTITELETNPVPLPPSAVLFVAALMGVCSLKVRHHGAAW